MRHKPNNLHLNSKFRCNERNSKKISPPKKQIRLHQNVKLFNTITKTLHHQKLSSFAWRPLDTPEPYSWVFKIPMRNYCWLNRVETHPVAETTPNVWSEGPLPKLSPSTIPKSITDITDIIVPTFHESNPGT